MSIPEWEASKENVAPVARGRNVETLNKALTADVEVLNSTRSFHESAIRDASNGIGPFADDPLAPWVNYTKWVIDNFPRGSDLIISVVEGACRRFAKDPRYREDRRFVRLWIRYADLRTDKLDVFAYMQKHHIGEHAALFYEAWATTLELTRDFDRAEQVYNVGMRLNAQPQERLAQRMREYYNRMAARARRAEKKAKEAKKRKEDAERAKETRATRNQPTLADNLLSRADKPDPDEESPHAPTDENAKPGAPIRKALGRLTERQADTGRRPMTAASKKKQSGLGQRSHPTEQGNMSGNAPNEKIEIYADPKPTGAPATQAEDPKEQDDFPFAPLAKAREVSKENAGSAPSKWTGVTLPQNPTAKKRVNRAMRPAGEPVQIYQETEEEHEESHCARKPGNSPGAGSAISSENPPSQNLDNEAMQPATESIQIYQDTKREEHRVAQQPGSSKDAVSSTRLSEAAENRPRSPRPTRKSAISMHGNSPTINTKIAMSEVDSLFNSSLPMEEERVRTFGSSRGSESQGDSTGRAGGTQAIEIYQDVMDEDKENIHRDRTRRTGVSSPSRNPPIERVLRSLPELEGPLIHRVVDESELMNSNNVAIRNGQDIPRQTQDENTAPTNAVNVPRQMLDENTAPTMAEEPLTQNSGRDEEQYPEPDEVDDPATLELIDFLAAWCYQAPGFHLLDGEDPEVSICEMFDLYPRNEHLVAINVVNLSWTGYTRTSNVFAVEDLNNTLGLRNQLEINDKEDNLLTLKVYKSSNPWEFYVYRTLQDRFEKPTTSIPNALAYFEGSPAGYLVLDRMCPLTLENIISSSSSIRITEGIAMFLVADLLRAVESIHAAGIIHSDVTLDNVLFRNNPREPLVEDRFMASDPGSWAANGILLVDFNHAIDTKRASSEGNMEDIVKHATKQGTSFLHPHYQMPNASNWGFNIDCYCAAICASRLLDVGVLQGQGGAAELRWESVWDTFFGSMERLQAMSNASETIDSMRRCREIMEAALFENKNLKTELEAFSKWAGNLTAE